MININTTTNTLSMTKESIYNFVLPQKNLYLVNDDCR